MFPPAVRCLTPQRLGEVKHWGRENGLDIDCPYRKADVGISEASYHLNSSTSHEKILRDYPSNTRKWSVIYEDLHILQITNILQGTGDIRNITITDIRCVVQSCLCFVQCGGDWGREKKRGSPKAFLQLCSSCDWSACVHFYSLTVYIFFFKWSTMWEQYVAVFRMSLVVTFPYNPPTSSIPSTNFHSAC